MTAGFQQGGFESIFAVEMGTGQAASAYAANFGEHHIWWGDITDMPDETIPEVDVVIGGPPYSGLLEPQQ